MLVEMGIVILRFGHRIIRDERATTHVCLTARALGAQKAVVSGEKDDKILASVRGICKKWGGNFEIEYAADYARFLKEIKKTHKVVHLTMYGSPILERINAIKKIENVCVVVGSQKVPPSIYEMADYNVSVTGQPHSEIAALAVFLDRYFDGKEFDFEFVGGMSVALNDSGKKIVLCK
ncbi:tRNA (cytidine(56)-2'-O)-methyltransferase [Candidatus Parvarchaeota archaeon]|nr:tRNA (cytidine(56)-2'-O)-methyltransferase [Candidatus Parvarchaeota archaeon]